MFENKVIAFTDPMARLSLNGVWCLGGILNLIVLPLFFFLFYFRKF